MGWLLHYNILEEREIWMFGEIIFVMDKFGSYETSHTNQENFIPNYLHLINISI